MFIFCSLPELKKKKKAKRKHVAIIDELEEIKFSKSDFLEAELCKEQKKFRIQMSH